MTQKGMRVLRPENFPGACPQNKIRCMCFKCHTDLSLCSSTGGEGAICMSPLLKINFKKTFEESCSTDWDCCFYAFSINFGWFQIFKQKSCSSWGLHPQTPWNSTSYYNNTTIFMLGGPCKSGLESPLYLILCQQKQTLDTNIATYILLNCHFFAT